MAHAYNPSYAGGGYQEDCLLKPAGAEFERPYLEKTHHKNRAGGVPQGEGPDFKPQECKIIIVIIIIRAKWTGGVSRGRAPALQV
jgi:hypothetical protein